MKNLEKFADYGLTGTFFLVTQVGFILCQLSGTTPGASGGWGALVEWTAGLHHALGDLASLAGTPLTQILTVLGVAAVFFCGLLLDLLGHWLVVFEVRVFRKHLRHNRRWVRAVARLSHGRADKDVERFLSGDDGHIFRLWRRYRSLFLSLGTYLRLWFVLIAYIATFCPSREPEELADNLRLWHVTRSVSTTLVVLSFELWVSCFPVTDWGSWLLCFALATATFLLAVSLDYAAFNRLCACLFSFGLTTYESRRELARPAAPPPPGPSVAESP